MALNAFPGRRRLSTIAIALLLGACTGAAQATSMTMFRDPDCGCCEAWAMQMRQGDRHEIATVDHPDMAPVQTQHGIPDDLRSCHTMVVGRYVIEGHVPVADVERLLAEAPEWVSGLAVPGMPLGSPGMEVGDTVQPYQVISFGNGRREVFASYS